MAEEESCPAHCSEPWLSNVFKMQDILRSHWERVFIGSILLAVLLIQSAAGADIKKVKKLFLPKKRGAARV